MTTRPDGMDEPPDAEGVSRETSGPASRLVAACARMGVTVGPGDAGRMVALLDRLALEPQNLTSVDGIAAGVDRHLADSASGLCLPAVRSARRLVDIGSGGGFPGLVLAMLLPECAVTLIESERRKAAWLTRASAELPNVRVMADRTENVARAAREEWDVVTARAVGPLPVVLELAAPLVRVDGDVVVWRGRRDPQEEASALRAAAELGLTPAELLDVQPFPGAHRALSRWHKVRTTPARYPRRPGRAMKRPIG